METSISISEIIRIASNFSVLVPFFFYVINLKGSSKAIHATGALIIISGIADLIGFISSSQHGLTATIFNIQDILQFTLLSWLFLELISLRKLRIITLRIILHSGIAVYIVAIITVSSFYQNFLENQSLMWTISGAIIIIFSIAYFFYLLSELPANNILTYPPAWINAGVFFYFSFSLFLFVISDYIFLKIEREIGLLIWSFHNVNNIIKNILFGIGLSLLYKGKS